MNNIQIEDYCKIGELSYINWEELKGKKFLITGSTGLIGSNLVNALLYLDKKKSLGVKLYLPVRNMKVANTLFSEYEDKVRVFHYVLGEKIEMEERVEYIVHLASPTDSLYFTERPVDTLIMNIEGTNAVLEFAKKTQCAKIVYLSTMEIYGFPEKGHKVFEDEIGSFETMNARNSYPIAKLSCEALCSAYFRQYMVPTVVIRATQVFGPGVKYNDGRIFAQFMRCIIENKDIVLKSLGLTERSYLYTADAVSAILIGLLRGEAGNAYTIANPETYCSIRDMAKIVVERIAENKIDIIFDVAEDIAKLGYAETLYMDLDISKMKLLGWNPSIGLEDMFRRMIESARNDNKFKSEKFYLNL